MAKNGAIVGKRLKKSLGKQIAEGVKKYGPEVAAALATALITGILDKAGTINVNATSSGRH